MADGIERFEAEIDLDVTFNEFDEEFSNAKERNLEPNKEKVISNNRKDVKYIARTAANVDGSSHRAGNETLDSANNLIKEEEGEVLSSSDGEGEEKMDLDEEADKDQNSLAGSKLTTSSEQEGLEKTDNFPFLSPNSIFRDFEKKESLEERRVDETLKRDYEAESAILSVESDSSMDDQSWKRKKRAKLEEQSNQGSDRERIKKTRGGRKRRKRGIQRHHEDEQEPRNSTFNLQDIESGNKKVLWALMVTPDDSEEAVANEIAAKLNESKVMLIQRIVTCIGCEKAIKLFRDTQEVERHGGMWTKDGYRRRTSGGVFLALLKHRYVTKEQSKWIFAIENEISKRKAKEEQQRMKEFHKKTVSDLRLKLKERDKV